LAQRAIENDEFLISRKVKIKESDTLLRLSGGDGRRLLNLLELVTQSNLATPLNITDKMVKNSVQQNMNIYDKGGEMHYDIISAFIKSIRGSDPNAAVYYLARMIAGGEDPKFIARRLVILSSEDIGLANPTALVMATNTFLAIERIGWPEGRIILSQCVIYLATSPKSNSAYVAIGEAQALVKETGDLSIPLSLRNAPTKLMKELNYGKDYKYSHQYDNNFVKQDFLPKEISGNILYNPGNNKRELTIRHQLKEMWQNKYGY